MRRRSGISTGSNGRLTREPFSSLRASSVTLAIHPPPLNNLLPTLPTPPAQIMSATALSERPFSKTQLFCSNLPWSVNGKVRSERVVPLPQSQPAVRQCPMQSTPVQLAERRATAPVADAAAGV